jgi:hypothetical protein
MHPWCIRGLSVVRPWFIRGASVADMLKVTIRTNQLSTEDFLI